MQGLWRTILVTSLGVFVLMTSTAGAQQQQQTPPSSSSPSAPQATPSTPPPGPGGSQMGQQGQLQVDANTILGSTVRDAQGKDIGKVSRLMIDPQEGRVTNVVIGMGGTLGMGEKLVSVPWNSVKVGQDQGKVIVSVDQQVLQQAPRAAEERKKDDKGSGAASPATEDKKNSDKKQ
jgi:sporulation protein YlmC with PRC-barrel domain